MAAQRPEEAYTSSPGFEKNAPNPIADLPFVKALVPRLLLQDASGTRVRALIQQPASRLGQGLPEKPLSGFLQALCPSKREPFPHPPWPEQTAPSPDPSLPPSNAVQARSQPAAPRDHRSELLPQARSPISSSLTSSSLASLSISSSLTSSSLQSLSSLQEAPGCQLARSSSSLPIVSSPRGSTQKKSPCRRGPPVGSRREGYLEPDSRKRASCQREHESSSPRLLGASPPERARREERHFSPLAT